MDRYFLVAFTGTKRGDQAAGSCQFTLDHFPGKKETSAWIIDAFGVSDVVITNIYEFKTKEDYDSFISN